MRIRTRWGLAAVLLAALAWSTSLRAEPDEDAEIKANRAKLGQQDQRLVEAQDRCPIMEDTRLGEMGPVLKLTIKGQPVFVCCKGCARKAQANPDHTLAKVAELKARNKAKQK